MPIGLDFQMHFWFNFYLYIDIKQTFFLEKSGTISKLYGSLTALKTSSIAKLFFEE